jgi:hypothetical protein
MSRLLVNVLKSVPDSLNQAIDNLSIINPLVTNLDGARYTNIVQNFVNLPYSFTGTTSRVGTEITPLNTTITTRTNNSKIFYNLFICYEMQENNVFFLQRIINGVVTEIGSGDASSLRGYGFTSATYDNNVDSTPAQSYLKFLDEPNVAAGTEINYVLRFYGNANHVLYLNRVANNADSFNYERGSSVVVLEEIVV